MKSYIAHHPWSIVEDRWHPDYNEISESIFSLGNGRFGQRANAEETFSGKSLQGNYVAGVYYPDKTRVGWWKNGYPEYFAKVLNAPDWTGIAIELDGEVLDLAKAEVEEFRRELNMQEGYLRRTFRARTTGGLEVAVEATRLCSIADDETAAIRYAVKALNFSGPITATLSVDGDVINSDSNYDEKFWNEVATHVSDDRGHVVVETKKTLFHVATGMQFKVFKNGAAQTIENADFITKEKYIASTVRVDVTDGDTVTFEKYVGVVSSLNYEKAALAAACEAAYTRAAQTGFDALLRAQREAWATKWAEADITIEGDVAAQQGIRFNIFQLYQTYTGEDARLNIGPKGFTGEKYGGSTYWDTEAYCLPFYLATAEQRVARNLLIYRHNQLDKAIENAAKLGFTDGAALYPMVTMNGEESHNEWEITFEEIHRNGAIAYAIYMYTEYTGDKAYLGEYGLDVLIAIARFWAQRVHWSERRGAYMMHGVTGPNEYENNINNNWYTNYIAAWCLRYCMEALDHVEQTDPTRYAEIKEANKFYPHTETKQWKDIVAKMYYPEDAELGIFEQHDGFLDKELMTVDDLRDEDRPLNQNWSWDRILRSIFIKQADVLQGLYFFEHEFDTATLKANFDFYEPRTVHESSLSPCIHAIQAAVLGYEDKAYEMYLRTARLDLDDYNNDTEDGCHITSMAGTWLAFVQGFGGMRVIDGQLRFKPMLPKQWDGYSFKIRFRGAVLKVEVDRSGIRFENESDTDLSLLLEDRTLTVAANGTLSEAFSN